MSTLIAIGNSQGIRIPKPLIKQAKLENSELEFVVVGNGLLIVPTHKPDRESWASDIETVTAAYEDREDKAFLDDFLDDSDLDDLSW